MSRIMVVDDSNMARMVVRRCLEIAGYAEVDILEASNGKEALVQLKESSIDLVIADLNMPLMDGESLLQWMKSVPQYQDIPVIFVTSAKNSAKEEQLKNLGAFAVLGKPFHPSVLTEVLETVKL